MWRNDRLDDPNKPALGGAAREGPNHPAHRRRIGLVAAVVAILVAAGGYGPTRLILRAQSQPQQPPTTVGSPGGFRSGHILVRFKQTPGQDVVDQLGATFGARVVGTVVGIGVSHLQVRPEQELPILRHLRSRPDVEFAEFDSMAQVLNVPNDPYYSTAYATSHDGNVAQWGLPAVSAPAAWDVTSPLGDSPIVIATVDTGVDCTHPDLAAKCVGQVTYVGSVTDAFGHGTHVAGIAAAVTNNGVGVAGICPNCRILSVKVLNDQGSGYISDIASGITYAADHGARVINLSLGGNGRTETLHLALQYAVAHNALPVCAMGNSNSVSNTPEPAYWYDCLSVIATDQQGARASFSNYGIKADVAAPGVAYLSTMPTFPCTLTTTYGYYQNYDALSGTSMATPVISGIAGLILSKNPSLSPAQVKGLIMAAAGDGANWTTDLAFGIINASTAASRAAYTALHQDLMAPPVPNLILPAVGGTVSGLVTVQAAPTDIDSPVHHVDIVKDGTRFMQVLTGSSGGKVKGGSTTPWTMSWPSTSVFNGAASISAIAIDPFGNTSAPQDRSFSIVNRLISQSWTAHVCSPSTPNCSNTTPWLPVTTGVATEAATHLHGTVTYTSMQSIKVSDFWIQLYSPGRTYYCGTDGTTVDCYPPVTLLPDPGRGSYSNYSGAQIDGISLKATASEQADVRWTLTYPQ